MGYSLHQDTNFVDLSEIDLKSIRSKEIRLAKCITLGLHKQQWDGELQTNAPTVTDETYEIAYPKFRLSRLTQPADFKNALQIYVNLEAELTDASSTRCLQRRFNDLICIGRRFKGCVELDQLFYLKNQIQSWICTHCCDGFSFDSFEEERIVIYDEDLMASNVFACYIPLQYTTTDKEQNGNIPELI